MHQLSLHPDARILMHWLVAAFRVLLLHRADEKSAVIVAGGLSTASRPRCVPANSARIDLLYCLTPILSHLHHHMFLNTWPPACTTPTQLLHFDCFFFTSCRVSKLHCM